MSIADDIIEAALSWVGTPYHHHAKVKGAGVDCIQLVLAAHEEAGLVEGIDTGTYSTDWYLHRSEDIYLAGVETHLRPVDELSLCIAARQAIDATWEAPRASVFVLRVGRTFSHGGVVTRWPMIVHASQPSEMVEHIDITKVPGLMKRDIKFYIYEGAVE
jgi:hypothetical protein